MASYNSAHGGRPIEHTMMGTRMDDPMTNALVIEYLARRDVVFIPVGTVEMHGSMPLGREHGPALTVPSRMASASRRYGGGSP
jgi:hypothetical protein